VGARGGTQIALQFAPSGHLTGGYVARYHSPEFALASKLHISPERTLAEIPPKTEGGESICLKK